MKVIQITNCFPPFAVGGAEVNAAKIAEGLSKSGYTVKTITIVTNKTDPAKFSDDVIPIRLFLSFDPWRDSERRDIPRLILLKICDFFNPLYFFRLLQVFKKEAPDIVLSHNLKGFSVSVWVAARMSGAKVIHVLHDYYLVCTNCSMVTKAGPCKDQCAKCKIYSHPRRLLASLVHRFIGVGQHVALEHRRHFAISSQKITIVNNYADGTRVDLRSSAIASAQPRPFTLGFIGRIEDVKGVPLIFKAVSLLKGASNIEIVLAGRESSKGYIRSLAEQYPTVVWRHLGFVRPHVFYSQCDCVIVPSTWAEPFPAVAYEPFEYGVPVLGSDLGGISEIVENEVSGLLFSAGDAEDLSRKIDRILSNPDLHARLQRGALAAWQRFSPSERMTNQYRSIIEEVAKN